MTSRPFTYAILLATLCSIVACSGGGDAGTETSGARSHSPAGIPGPPAPEVSDSVRAQRDNFLADEGRIRPEWLPQGFTLRVIDETDLGRADAPLFLMCDHNGMNPADPLWRLSLQSDGSWQIFIPEQNSAERLRFLVTRGSVDTAQTRPPGPANEYCNLGMILHEYHAEGQPCVRTIIIDGWRDAP